jgi:hypothetical protein
VFSDTFIPVHKPITRIFLEVRFVAKASGNSKTVFVVQANIIGEIIKQGTFVGKFFTNESNFAFAPLH